MKDRLAANSLEIVRHRMVTEGIDAWEALRRVSSQVVFTTHTPVPAGHDYFPASLVDEHLGPLRQSLRLGRDEFMGLGRSVPQLAARIMERGDRSPRRRRAASS